MLFCEVSCFSGLLGFSHCTLLGSGKCYLEVSKEKRTVLSYFKVHVCTRMGDPLQATINSNDKVMAKLSIVDFDGEGVKALNKPWGKTPRHRDFVKMSFLMPY